MKTILFSPLGNTDPITGYRDGACLHILRHYRPDGVVLFYTKEIADKEFKTKAGSWYQESIAMLAAFLQCSFPIIKTYQSDIIDAHKMDILATALPQAVMDVHETYLDAQLLLNISSGTPQIKTILSLLAVEYPWCTAIQVAGPANTKTGKVTHEKHVENNEDYDIDTLFDMNLDNEKDAPNRCSESPLETIRFFREKNQLLSLILEYEYAGAYALSSKTMRVSSTIQTLLCHAKYRQNLALPKAKDLLPTYKGRNLFPFDEDKPISEKQKLCDYALIMQLNQQKGQLADFIVKVVPFLYEVLLHYVLDAKKISLLRYCNIDGNKDYVLQQKKMQIDEIGKQLADYLNAHVSGRLGRYKDSKVSYYLLEHICHFMEVQQLANDEAKHTQIIEILKCIKKVNTIRNLAAHQVVDTSEEKLVQKLKISSQQLMNYLYQLLCLVYGDDCRHMRSFYDTLNTWIMDELQAMTKEGIKPTVQ